MGPSAKSPAATRVSSSSTTMVKEATCVHEKSRRFCILTEFPGTMENNKATETGSIPALSVTAGQTINGNGGANQDPSMIPNPKLGMAPLSSELAVAAASNNVTADGHQPSNRSPPDPFQSADPQSTRNSMPPPNDPFQSRPVVTDPPQVLTIPPPSETEQAPQVNNPSSSLPGATAPPPDPTPSADPVEPSHLPHPNPTPSDPPPVDPPIDAASHPPNVNSDQKEKS